MKMEISNDTISLTISTENKELVAKLLQTEMDACRNKLIHLQRVENDERYGGDTTWWSGGCRVQPDRAANIMYDAMENWAALENMIKQLEEIKK